MIRQSSGDMIDRQNKHRYMYTSLEISSIRANVDNVQILCNILNHQQD